MSGAPVPASWHHVRVNAFKGVALLPSLLASILTIRLLLPQDAAGAEPGAGTPLHRAVLTGVVAAVAATATPENMEARDELGLTAFQVGVQQGQLETAAWLLDHGADVNARDPDGNTALHLVILQRPQEVRLPSTSWMFLRQLDIRKEPFLVCLTNQHQWPGVRVVAFLLAAGVDTRATNRFGKTALQLASADNILLFPEERSAILTLLAQSDGGAEMRDENGDTVLHRAARSNATANVEALVAGGANVNATNYQGRTPLHVSVENLRQWGHTSLEELLKAKPNVNAHDNEGLTALHVLALSSSSFKKEPTKALLAAGADPNARDKHGRTPAHLFFTGSWPWLEVRECMTVLLSAGADLSLADDRGQTPLHYLAALGGKRPSFFVIGRGPNSGDDWPKLNLEVQDNQGDTPLHVAARSGTWDVFDWLVQRGANLDLTNRAGETPRLLAARSPDRMRTFGSGRSGAQTDIFQAAREGNVQAATSLLKADPELLNATSRTGDTPLRTAAVLRQTNVVEFLISQGARWDAISAVMMGRVDGLQGVLLRGGEATTNLCLGRGALHWAAIHRHPEVARLLIGAGYDVAAEDAWGLSPLGRAMLSAQKDVAEVLRQHGARENIFDAVYTENVVAAASLLAADGSLVQAASRTGPPVVEIAAAASRVDLLELVLSHGAAADVVNRRTGQTPLHVAAQHNRAGNVQLLIRRGAKVDRPDVYGLTPLHIAAIQGASEAAAELLKSGADVRLIVSNSTGGRHVPIGFGGGSALPGNTALHLAAMCGHPETVEVLLKAGAPVNAANASGRMALDLANHPGFDAPDVWLEHATFDNWEPLAPAQPRAVRARQDEAERRRAVAALLEQAGGERSLMIRPRTRPSVVMPPRN